MQMLRYAIILFDWSLQLFVLKKNMIFPTYPINSIQGIN